MNSVHQFCWLRIAIIVIEDSECLYFAIRRLRGGGGGFDV